jgi:hypothetical protein
MKTDLLSQSGFFLLTLLCLFLLLSGLFRSLFRAGMDSTVCRQWVLRAGLVLAGWLLLSAALAYTGFLAEFSTVPPRMLVIILPPLIVILLLTFSSGFKRVLSYTPPHWLFYLQGFRMVVELLLWRLFAVGLLPFQMTFEGWNFDVLVGLTGPMIGWLAARKRLPRWAAIGWNVAGLLLLVNIVVIALLSAPTPFQVFKYEPANIVIAQFPIVWLPGFLVPLAYSLHFFSLRQWALGALPVSVRKAPLKV